MNTKTVKNKAPKISCLKVSRRLCQQNFLRLCKQNSIHDCKECFHRIFCSIVKYTFTRTKSHIYPHSAIFFYGPHFIAKFPLSGTIRIWLSS